MDNDRNYWDGWMKRRMSRRAMLRRAGCAGLVVAGGSALWACGQPETPKAAEPTAAKAGTTPAATPAATPVPRPKRGGTLRIGVNKSEQPENLDAHVYINSTNDVYFRAIFDWIVNHNDRLEYTPSMSLAESWEAKDDVTFLFKLRKGVKFSDGTPFDAKVLKFNIDRIADKETKSPRAYVVASTKSIEYPDDYSMKMVLKEPAASFFGDLAHAGFAMMSPAAIAKYGSKELARNPIGTGPFVVSEYLPDDHYLLNRNKDYWQKDATGDALPYVDAVRIAVIPDDTVRLANLRTGVIDMDKMAQLKDVAKLQEDPNLKVILQHGVTMRGMYWNLSRPPFNNLNFRKAMQYGINREAIIKVVTFGLSKAYSGIVLPSAAWAFDPNRPVFPYDPVKAKQYLDRAIAEGVKTEFNTRSYPTPETLQPAQMAQADLAKIGIKMNLTTEESSTVTYRYWTSFEIDSMWSGYAMVADPYSKIIVAHHSKGSYAPEKRSLGDPNWDTPEGYFAKLDPLIDGANRTYDPKKRAELLNKASDVLDENGGFLGLYYGSVAMAMHKKVEGATYGGDGKGRFDRVWLNV